MAQTFRIDLFNRHRLSDPSVTARLWKRLDNPLVEPAKFDSVEQARRDFNAEAASEAAKLFDERLHLFVRGASDGFLAHFSEYRRNLSIWTIRLDAGAMEGAKGERWLEWAFELCAEFPVFFGSGCAVDEYEAKHATGRVAEGGVAVHEARGISIAEFFRYLPGLYWLTVFGPELTRAFGAERLKSLPGTRAHEIVGDQIAVQLDEPPVPEDMDARLSKEAGLAERLGAEFFFDPERDPKELRQVPELAEALEAGDG